MCCIITCVILHFPEEALHERTMEMILVKLSIEFYFYFFVCFLFLKQANWTGEHEKALDRKLLYSQILKIHEKRMDF